MADQTVVASIREATDIIEIIGEVVPLKKRGNNHFGCCPFHNEDTPSFSVHQSKQLFHCFGCKIGGDVLKFVQEYYKWDFPQALEELGKKAGIQVKSYQADPLWEEGFIILETTANLFAASIDEESAKNYRDYLRERNIPEETWKSFRLGAHLGQQDFVVSHLKKKSLNLGLAADLGLLSRTKSGGFIDRFRGRLMFPILDEKGRTRGFGGRTMNNDQPKYLNSPKSKHFDKSRLFYGMHLASSGIRKKGYSVLVEGYFDVVSLHEFGLTNAVGSMGTALSQEQIRTLKRWSSRVVSLYDSDKAGLLATEKNLGNFLQQGVECKVVSLPGAKDPDAFLHEEGSSKEEKKKAIRAAFQAAKPALDFLIENSVLSVENAMERGKRIRELVDILNQVPDEIERTYLKKDVARRFGLPEELILSSESRTTASKASFRSPQPKRALSGVLPGETSRQEGRWEKQLLRFVVLHGDALNVPLTEVVPFLSSETTWGAFALKLIERGLSSARISALDWLENEDRPEVANVREWAMEDSEKLSEEELNATWSDLQNRIRESYFKRESMRLQIEIEGAQQSGDQGSIRSLLQQKQDLIRMLRMERTDTYAG